MLKVKGILILSLLLLTQSSFLKKDRWVAYKSNEFGYSIKFPRAPKLSTESIKTHVGNLKMNLCTVSKERFKRDDNLVYLTNCTEYPEKLVNSDKKEASINNIFRNAIDATANNLNALLVSEKVIEHDGYPGREIILNYQNGKAEIKIRMFLVQYYIYTIEVITKKKKRGNPAIDYFFDSFQLTNS